MATELAMSRFWDDLQEDLKDPEFRRQYEYTQAEHLAKVYQWQIDANRLRDGDEMCPLGCTEAEVTEMLGDDLPRFREWMYGQTVTLCEGRLYNHELKQYEASDCFDNPHGVVFYRSDVERFLAGLPVID